MEEKINLYESFRRKFTQKNLNQKLKDRFRFSKTKGIDRINGYQFFDQSKKHIKVINKKCIAGIYEFAPYLEVLKSKGRDNYPRVISIPTVRDRIVLSTIKDILFEVFSECVPRKLANTYVQDISKIISNKDISAFKVYKVDINDFYGSINHEFLIEMLKRKIKSKKIIKLINDSINNLTVPREYRKNSINKYIRKDGVGIPQGLSISNILASIYFHDIDNIFKNSNKCLYFRYVDDILIVARLESIDEAVNSLNEEVKNLNLVLNDSKTLRTSIDDGFEYLGYYFRGSKITVRQAAIDRFINSIAAKFSAYRYIFNKNFRKQNFCAVKFQKPFIDELNEKITGAISDNKKYGWIFYFNAINELSVLYKIDKIIFNMFRRLEDFDRKPPETLKKLSRSFFEAKYNINGGYIHDYNQYNSIDKKRNFLMDRNRLDPSKVYSDIDIDILFSRYKNIQLSQLDKDESLVY